MSNKENIYVAIESSYYGSNMLYENALSTLPNQTFKTEKSRKSPFLQLEPVNQMYMDFLMEYWNQCPSQAQESKGKDLKLPNCTGDMKNNRFFFGYRPSNSYGMMHYDYTYKECEKNDSGRTVFFLDGRLRLMVFLFAKQDLDLPHIFRTQSIHLGHVMKCSASLTTSKTFVLLRHVPDEML